MLFDTFRGHIPFSLSEEALKKLENEESETVSRHILDMMAHNQVYYTRSETIPHCVHKCHLEEEIETLGSHSHNESVLKCFVGNTSSFHVEIAVRTPSLSKPLEVLDSNNDDVLSLYCGFDQ